MVNFENIPEELKNVNRWVLWKYEEINGKKKKVPVNVFEKRINFTNSNNWLTFAEVLNTYEKGGSEGIGFVLGDSFAGLDLDNCIDESGKVAQWAKGLLQILPPTYAEISPSGKGIKLFFKITGDGMAASKRSGSVEFYTQGRFFTVTGDKLRNAPNYLNEIDVAIESLKTIVIAADIENVKYGEDLQELFLGNTSAYKTPSEADLAFLNMLVKRCKIKSPEELEFIANLSALKRQKWFEKHDSNGRTYLQMTLEKALAGAGNENMPYGVQDNRIVLWKKVENTLVPQPLCNFTAQIEEEISVDDGAEQKLNFKIVGKLATGEPLGEIIVPADKFTNLNWLVSQWGSRAVVNAGNSAKDHLRAAIQMLSHPTRKNVFSHIGWRKLEGKWLFLHGRGGIGADTAVIVDVEPEADTLRRYVLPNDTGVDAKDAVKFALQFLEIAPLEMVVPIFAAIWRAPLNTVLYAPLMLWVYGETGSYKSTITALALSFYGKFDKDSLTASWSATENYLEKLAFLARDVLLVIDDFAPEFSRHSQEELSKKVSRVVRNAGNRAHRGRIRSDLTLRPEYPPNALVISTAEQLPPSSMSLIGRTLLVKFEKEKANLEKLTFMQEHAQILPYAMRAYLHWLAPQLDSLADSLPQRLVELRNKAAVEGHARLPENVAHLMLGIEIFSNFAFDVGALTPQEVKKLNALAWDTLMNLA